MFKNKQHKSNEITELIVQKYFCSCGYTVSKPINHFAEYDLIIDFEGNLFRIQVKTIYKMCDEIHDKSNDKRYICNLEVPRRKGNGIYERKRYNENSFDFLCAVDPKTEIIYIVPIDEVLKRKRGMSFYPEGGTMKKHKNEIFKFNRDEIEKI